MSIIRKVEKKKPTKKAYKIMLPIEVTDRIDEARRICKQLGYEFALQEEIEKQIIRLLKKSEDDIEVLRAEYAENVKKANEDN